ncbi:D-glycero-beta-D-manno-heptose 1-phosphate adenylyltransferase [Alcaligenes aquatilis]|jgi:rfaE bifunctional protein nucleotidyltransferase chain/domain|uniref:D-glycero-beta-D-manno-heptose 1-phosphate adenylyltransferase n=2 Tax=Alcaligenes TaxID=507 RepID=A0AB33D3V0_ALCFA|nr:MULTISPECIES: D-glycero-beta-D-manno-heptose 1-phosphate adenylyltransferase [Alcaligenes]ASR90868.1 D-glycero-beta-D-manno-heptose 1-phosphate adenylyltransferase [Alcaligenes faecalis]AWG36468.1 D-glycero-beta-D-manno-heptose 1-phosphate adenylyltransferase [Alcaligenes aquatilis]MCC9164496.1 D-glycero-beta-D-manno-heptose 1-phosphate adenylyltransferase [Alcaligenes sp. MMA]MCH4223691.1 D-glycero-beta-D-manno-heptose 1-phosphate adenylyltransferase [Alcaligenes faecalis]QXR35529.1 D-glyc
MSVRFEAKVLGLDALREAMEQGRLARPLVFTNGVFDILHRGHVSYLDEAAQLGASLIVGVNTDASVRRLNKGPERPINPEQDRAALLAALACVDAVVLFDEDTPEALIAALRPDLIVKGGDYDMEALPETALVRSWGGDAVAIPFEFQRSTTALVKKLRD